MKVSFSKISSLFIISVFVISGCSSDALDCTAGTSCDDDNSDTYNDVFDADCLCAGTLDVFTDPRDGQMYNTVKIGNQTWMVENLNFIPSSGDFWCYSDNAFGCSIYGRLYDWETAQSVSPDGWHLPSLAEWTTLINHYGGEDVASGPLKEAGLSHWNTPNTGSTNSSGFTALPGGERGNNGAFLDVGEYGNWWTSDELDATKANSIYMYFENDDVESSAKDKERGISVRCIRD